MLRILTVIGARPQIIKAAALSRAIRNSFSDQIREIILHTGQHYDENMSEIFFQELGIPSAAVNLQIGSGTHGEQTAKMISGIEKVLIEEKPDAIVLYGDTNSTLAGAVAASKIHIPVVHIEAGLRSFNKSMPEEINRIMCDHVSSLLFSPTEIGVENLRKEGFSLSNTPPFTADNPGVFRCGDIMFDNSLFFAEISKSKESVFKDLGIPAGNYILATLHRDSNTDHPERITSIFSAFLEITESEEMDLILPIHPRTKKCMDLYLDKDIRNRVEKSKWIHLIPPASFLEMTALERNAKVVLTDSGGVQKEAYYFGRPCVIMRPQTEWVELVELGAAILADAGKERIVEAFHALKDKDISNLPKVYGDGKAAEFICATMLQFIPKSA